MAFPSPGAGLSPDELSHGNSHFMEMRWNSTCYGFCLDFRALAITTPYR
jgi:hypothetical protein